MLEAVEKIYTVLESTMKATDEVLPEARARQTAPLEPGDPGPLRGVPELGAFHGRDQSIETVRSMLLAEDAAMVGVSGRPVGVQGRGGVGKTKLAIRLARDDQVRGAFPDGVFWVAAGQEPELFRLQLDLLAELGEPTEGFTRVDQTKEALTHAFQDRRALLIVDDVWQSDVASAFDVVGPRCRLLMTTRQASNLRGLGASEHELDVLSPDEARQFLLAELERTVASSQTLDQLAEAAGYVPLSLSLAAALVESGVPWGQVVERLEESRDVFARHPQAGVLGAMLAAAAALADRRPLYQALVAYPEDTPIPKDELAILWEHIGGLDREGTDTLVADLTRRSLIIVDGDQVRVHDLQREFLILVETDIPAAHRRLLDAHRHRCRIPDRVVDLAR